MCNVVCSIQLIQLNYGSILSLCLIGYLTTLMSDVHVSDVHIYGGGGGGGGGGGHIIMTVILRLFARRASAETV